MIQASVSPAGEGECKGSAGFHAVCSAFPYGREAQPWIYTFRYTAQQAGRHIVVFTSLCFVDVPGRITKC